MALQSQSFRGDPKLEAAAVSDPAHILPGSSGPHVGKIQQALIQLDGASLVQDSAYGPATAAAVAAFKRKRQILNSSGQIDNIVGKKTIAALDSEMLAKERGGGAGVPGAAPGAGGLRLNFKIKDEDKRHTMIYFSGVVDDQGFGGVIISGTIHGQEILTDMENMRTVNADKVVLGIGGSLNNKFSGPAAAVAFIAANRDPRGKVIIYGFSAGGVNSLDTCRALNAAGINVDLLVLVDASGRGESVNRSVPANVALTRNYFQTQVFTVSRAVGAPASGARVQNINCDGRSFEILTTKSRHGQMQGVTRSDANADMRKELNRPS